MKLQHHDNVPRLARGARPGLLEVACEPHLLFAMIPANIMSPALWDFRERINRRATRIEADSPARHTQIVMEEIHEYMNKHLFHVSPLEVEAIWGCVDLREERKRLDAAELDYAIDLIRRAVEDRRARGILTDKQDMLPLIDAGRFPDYEYSVIDLIRAHRRHLGRRKHKPAGITSCADEAVLAASLAWAAGHAPIENIILLGSPAHYCTLVRRKKQAYWFNGKQEYFDAHSWSKLCGTSDPADIQEAFDNRVQGFDRIVTPFGVHRLSTNESTMRPERLAQTHDALRAFFGTDLQPIAEARKGPIRFIPDPSQEIEWEELDQTTDAASARTCLRELARAYPGSIVETAHYAFRDLWVDYPEAYGEAAARGHLVRERAEGVRNVTHALDVLRGIQGEDSIFDDVDRIMMPDEVLLFNTGAHRDRALLLSTLLLHAPCLNQNEKNGMELIFCEADSRVRIGQMLISARSLEDVPDPRDRPLLRLSMNPGKSTDS